MLGLDTQMLSSHTAAVVVVVAAVVKRGRWEGLAVEVLAVSGDASEPLVGVGDGVRAVVCHHLEAVVEAAGGEGRRRVEDTM